MRGSDAMGAVRLGGCGIRSVGVSHPGGTRTRHRDGTRASRPRRGRDRRYLEVQRRRRGRAPAGVARARGVEESPSRASTTIPDLHHSPDEPGRRREDSTRREPQRRYCTSGADAMTMRWRGVARSGSARGGGGRRRDGRSAGGVEQLALVGRRLHVRRRRMRGGALKGKNSLRRDAARLPRPADTRARERARRRDDAGELGGGPRRKYRPRRRWRACRVTRDARTPSIGRSAQTRSGSPRTSKTRRTCAWKTARVWKTKRSRREAPRSARGPGIAARWYRTVVRYSTRLLLRLARTTTRTG